MLVYLRITLDVFISPHKQTHKHKILTQKSITSVNLKQLHNYMQTHYQHSHHWHNYAMYTVGLIFKLQNLLGAYLMA